MAGYAAILIRSLTTIVEIVARYRRCLQSGVRRRQTSVQCRRPQFFGVVDRAIAVVVDVVVGQVGTRVQVRKILGGFSIRPGGENVESAVIGYDAARVAYVAYWRA